MKKQSFRLTVSLCCAGLVLGAVLASHAGYIVRNGQPGAHIHIPESSGRPVVLAVEELRTYIHKMTGAMLPIDYGPPVTGNRIVLAVDAQAGSIEDGSDQAFRIETSINPRHGSVLTIRGNSDLALLYGVYQYLHELGVRWFTPGDIGENVPTLTDIPIVARDDDYRPAFRTRIMDFSGMHDSHFDTSDPDRYRDEIHRDWDLWLLRNRLHFRRSIHSRNIHRFAFGWARESGGHGLLSWALHGADIETEPERFALVTRDGVAERRASGGVQICFSHPANVTTAIERVVEVLSAEPDPARLMHPNREWLFVPMGLADCSGICECADCELVGGEPPYHRDRLVWHYYNQVARGVAERKPGKGISLYAPYYEMRRPPPDVRIEPNILAVSCRGYAWNADPENVDTYPFSRDHIENTEATRAAGAQIGTYDYVMWRGTPQPLNILDAAEAYGSMDNVYYEVEVMQRGEQIWPILWSLARHAWDSDAPPRANLRDFCRQYYGAAGEAVLEVLERIDASSHKLPRIGYGGLSDTQRIMSETVIREGGDLLDRALSGVTGKARERLERFRKTFDMYAVQARGTRTYYRAINDRTPATIRESGEALDAFIAFWERANLSEICSPSILAQRRRLRAIEIAETVLPKARDGLETAEARLRDLFAFDTVPDAVDNLFFLPEVWRFRLDIKDNGLETGWHTEAFDDTAWQAISTWNFFEPQGFTEVDGRFWYRLRFDAPRFPADRKIILRIGSLDDDGDIYINGQLAYSRKHDFPDAWQSSFEFDATPYIRPGAANTIAVRGYDAFGAGGLWRPSALYAR